jgi:hypothetical protein
VSHLWGCAKHIGSFVQFVNLFSFVIFYQSYDFINCWFFCQHNPPISSVTCGRRTPNPLSSFWVGSVYTKAATTTTTTTLTITPERHLQVPALAALSKWQQLHCCYSVITNTTPHILSYHDSGSRELQIQWQREQKLDSENNMSL